MARLSRRQFLNGAALATAGSALTVLGGASVAFAADEAAADKSAETTDEKAQGTSVATVGKGMGKHGNIEVEVVTNDDGDIERLRNVIVGRSGYEAAGATHS